MKPRGNASKKGRKNAQASASVTSSHAKSAKAKATSRGRSTKKKPIAEDDSSDQIIENTFPVVLTTYEMVIKDRAQLAAYSWGYIVVDEGHRLKNFDSKLMREIKKYESAGRMVLTGTPLQNNLAEVRSILSHSLISGVVANSNGLYSCGAC
jgi:ATP-dependent DNA helicase